MLARAQANHAKSGNADNVSFIEAQITFIPLEDDIADCIISNCVINLVPEAEKPAVFAEMARLLKPGGRVAISDILARKPFPKELRESFAAYVGCVAGCSLKEEYERLLTENGFCGKYSCPRYSHGLKLIGPDVVIVDTKSDLNVYINLGNEGKQEDGQAANCCSNTSSKASNSKREGIISTLAEIDLNEWAGKCFCRISLCR